jgi:hypothetical protein
MRIATGAPHPAWDDIEFALDCADRELRSYYDTVTGEVHVTGPFEDDPGERERIDADPARYLEIDHLHSHTEYEWMERFTNEVADPRLQARLERALGGNRCFRRFKDTLKSAPDERDQWFALRDRLIKQQIEQWFTDHDLPVAALPPWASETSQTTDPSGFVAPLPG